MKAANSSQYVFIFNIDNNFVHVINPKNSEPPDLQPLSFGRNLKNEGDFAQVSCIVSEGYEPLVLSWTFHGQDISSDLGITTMSMGTRGSALIIQSVGHRHRGNYSCQAKNSAGTKFKTIELKVNGN